MKNRLFKLSSAAMILALILVLLPANMQSAYAAGPVVFINEIHYDNTGTDTGEAVEIAGPAGTDLSGWSVVLYNGNNGAVYDTDALSGTIPDLGGGHGVVVLTYPSNGLQNGAPDGIALVQGSTVVQFLSYEGSFTAVGGPADGMLSVDIGVSQSGSGAVGNSLQLTGTGTGYDDFSWVGEAANTFGTFNTGQTFGVVSPIVVINEIDYDQPSTDMAEFIELKNTGSVPADLSLFHLDLVNGSGGTVYLSIPLPAVELAVGGYFVICASSATTALCDLDISPDSNLIQNGAPDAVALYYDGMLIDAVSYEGDTAAPFTEGSGAGLVDDGASATGGISRCEDGVDTNQNNVDFVAAEITPGAVNACAPPPPVEMCVLPDTPIYAVQGSGPVAAISGVVTVQGVVVGDFEGPSPQLRGFYLQEITGDGDPATSDGIFVFNGGSEQVNLGEVVQVTGTAMEFQDQTQIGSVSSVEICDATASVEAVEVTLPVPSLDYLEQFEGMLVHFPQTLYVTEHFQLGRFGQVVLSADDRLKQPTNIVLPGADALAMQAANNLNRIILDDSTNNQNPDPIIFGDNGMPLSASNTLRGGDSATGITGVLTYTWAGNAASGNAYRIRPLNAMDGYVWFDINNPRPEAAPERSGRLRVTSMNLLNFFNTFNDGNAGTPGCFPSGLDSDCRGAESEFEFERQWAKTVQAMLDSQADVIGVVEIENDGYGPDSALQFLVDRLNDAAGAGTFAFIDVDTATGQMNALGTDAIKVGMLYRPAMVTPVGNTAVLNTVEFVNGGDADPRNRPALAQAFEEVGTGAQFVVSVNHLKSKGSACETADALDGQGNCNIVRLNAANALTAWLAADPTGTGQPDALIMGDLNSYALEDPIRAIEDAGYTNLLAAYHGDEAYSYVFDGQWGYLDHALATAGMTAQVVAVNEWHINADEPSVLDYNTNFKSEAQITSLYAPDQFRISDHDAILVDIDPDFMAPDIEIVLSHRQLWPPNHQYVTVTADVIVNDNLDPNPLIELVEVLSSEPDDGLGDGDTPNDIVILDDFTFDLRAERSAQGPGRWYKIKYRVTDFAGNVSYHTAAVFVPKNQKK